jgi:hypothetical protein
MFSHSTNDVRLFAVKRGPCKKEVGFNWYHHDDDDDYHY